MLTLHEALDTIGPGVRSTEGVGVEFTYELASESASGPEHPLGGLASHGQLHSKLVRYVPSTLGVHKRESECVPGLEDRPVVVAQPFLDPVHASRMPSRVACSAWCW